MGRGAARAGLAFLVLFHLTPTPAWEPETRVAIADEAIRFMPASLRKVLERHRQPLMRGMLTPLTAEDGPDHRPEWSGGRLEDRLARETGALAARLEQPGAFTDIAEQFGRVAHFVADAGFPPGMSDGDGARRYKRFARLCEIRREKFPLVFYGHDDPDLDRGDFRAWSRTRMRRSMLEDRTLSRAYAEAGDPADPDAFDDRSVPFAIASLNYSRTVTDVVRVWLTIWRDAGGDMGDTPYFKKKPEPRAK